MLPRNLPSCKIEILLPVYDLALQEFSVAEEDRVPAQCLGGHRLESCWGLGVFSLSHARGMLIISFSHI